MLRVLTDLFKPGIENILTTHDQISPSQFRVLLFADDYGPTLQINWMRPLAQARSTGACAVWVLEERAVEAFAKKTNSEELATQLNKILAKLRPDVVVASRYAGASVSSIINLSRIADIPLIFHIDDNLLDIPPELGAAKQAKYGSTERIAALKSFLANADLAYISTPGLLQQLLEHGAQLRRYFVGEIAGGVNPVGVSLNKGQAGRVRIGYMGSRSHTHDLALVTPVIADILKTHNNVQFELFGSIEMPAALKDCRVAHHAPESNYDRFIAKLSSLQWDVGLAPLRDTKFNLAKTNTKWIEYTAAGIPAICSRHPVYADVSAENGAMLAVTESEWHAALIKLIQQTNARQELIAAAQTLLEKRFTVAHLTKQLTDVFAAAGLDSRSSKLSSLRC